MDSSVREKVRSTYETKHGGSVNEQSHHKGSRRFKNISSGKQQQSAVGNISSTAKNRKINNEIDRREANNQPSFGNDKTQKSNRSLNSSSDNSQRNTRSIPEAKPQQRSIEKIKSESTVLNGAATMIEEQGIINADKTGIAAEFVNTSFEDTIKDSVIKTPEAAIFSEKTWGDTNTNEKKSILKSVGSVAIRELEADSGGSHNHDLSDRSKAIANKYGYKTGKFAALGGFTFARGTYRIVQYRNKLSKDVTSGLLTTKEARRAILERTRSSVIGSRSSIKQVIKREAIKEIEDFQGSDDLGMQAIRKPKDMVVKTQRTYRMISSTGKAAKKSIQGTSKAAQKVAQKAVTAAKYTVGTIKKTFSNPLVIKGTIVVAIIVFCIALLLAIVSAVMSIIPTVSLKSDDRELTRTYEHITKLDAEFTDEVRGLKTSWSYGNVDEFHYYVNGYETTADGITVYTNADNVLLYLDSKYDDYAFDKLIYGLFGGTNIKEEITALHQSLYSYTTHKWEQVIEHESSFIDDDGREHSNGWTETIIHMDINVDLTSFESYLSEHIDEMLTEDEQERMNALNTVGVYTSKIQLGNPFGDQTYFVSSRWGWRIHPITGELSKHTGIDIPKAARTPINNVMYGEVTNVGYDSSRGNYVIITCGKREVLYAHMRNVAVFEGQTLEKGDLVGYVGSTGSSTGNHLHLEYSIENGFNTNPSFFLEGASIVGAGSTDIVQAAASQVGNVGGRPYWSWYGFGSRVEWCACFVSWCANQCGYIESGVIPKFASCGSGGVPWFKSHGLWQSGGGSYIPKTGDIIFFDWDLNGAPNHVGIVENCDGNTVYTIEGNSGNACRRKSYNLYSSVIYGYGTPAY